MNIYLIRHADAERISLSVPDAERKLTKEGKNSLKAAAEKWRRLVHSFDYIVSSPMARALQTAKIIAEVFEFEDEIIKEEKLAGKGSTEDIVNFLNSLEGEDIAVVGHQPDLSHYLSSLISNSGANVEFKKAAIAKISFSNRVLQGKGQLEFLIPPAAFR